ncbi:hypothetical protein [Streptomyces sp. NRRL B-24085]|uniref:hypothetical protein n=1 Tax=Streptomyces sp. NRRL B-24085 TaxID=1709476 RepID=UPI0006B3B66C|nr:hypothetical protein [Streptomyces sp. NRRL B-24085]
MTVLTRRKSIASLIAAAGVSGLLMTGAPNSAADTAAPAPKNCAVLVGKAPANGKASPELYRYCSTKSAADARAHLETKAATGGRSAQATLLMVWYANTDYRTPSTSVYGNAGPCDSSGYSLHPDSYWSQNISSARGYNRCTVATFHNRALNYATTFRLPVPYLGANLNDNVGLIQTWYG